MTNPAWNRMDRVAWIDLSSSDPAASRAFYGAVFGWDIEVSPDPQFGGYGIARIGGTDVAGIGGQMTPGMPTTWSVYIGTADAAALGGKVAAAGGTVVAPAFDIGSMGRMAVFQDPAGAFISAWQPAEMGSFLSDEPNTFVWAEQSSRDLERIVPFYGTVFGWEPQHMGPQMGDYVMFKQGGSHVAGALPMSAMVPAEVPSYWGIYFGVDDVDATWQQAIDAGATEVMAPQDFPGGRFGVLRDPQGAVFSIRAHEARG